jgi:hypothetical protein
MQGYITAFWHVASHKSGMYRLHVGTDITKWGSYRELAEFINHNVRAIVGPHGGGLMHLMWGARNTLVLEFQVDVRVNYAMWELSPLLGHNCKGGGLRGGIWRGMWRVGTHVRALTVRPNLIGAGLVTLPILVLQLA